MANFFGLIYSFKASLRKTKITKRKLLFFVLLFLVSFGAFLIPKTILAAPSTSSALPRFLYTPKPIPDQPAISNPKIITINGQDFQATNELWARIETGYNPIPPNSG